ncbi:DNA/RNA helicase domain-containing protein [Pseudomonas syringae]|uniref:DNA/RNA helicase domain-containing protein n=1 Tax=Pseudomonas syringae TaxID=317 RepID=UPI003204AE41
MKYINLLSLVQASDSLAPLSFNDFLDLHGIQIKPSEIVDLKVLLEALYALPSQISIFDKFYAGYKIPQIGKEFDLLRFGREFIVNIELKQTCSKDKVKAQLVRNKYYLGCIGRKVYAFTYVVDVATLYGLQDDDDLVKVDLVLLRDLLDSQDIDRTEAVDDLFDPSDFLVSPFNSTQKFLEGKYFLTHQQEEIKSLTLQHFSGPKSAKFVSVVGSAGTGKTLLVYDMADQLRRAGRNVLVIHCGYLNEGQNELVKNGWKIVPIKNYSSCNLAAYDLVVVDEAQRIYARQLKDVIEKVETAKGSCIFSYDKVQTLSNSEEKAKIDEKINAINGLIVNRLSEKIRTNKEIATFVKMLFNNKRKLALEGRENIQINYFKNPEDAKFYLSSLDEPGWEVLRFTPSQYNKEHHGDYFSRDEKTSHQVIGQEFDGVVITLDRYFSYDNDGKLCYTGCAYYHPVMMLFQNITRARKYLNLVIVDNEKLLNRCVSILQ